MKPQFSKETIVSIIEQLVGEISPVGQSERDAISFENLKLLCDVTDALLTKVSDVSTNNKNAYEHSVKRSQEYAERFLMDVKETYPMVF